MKDKHAKIIKKLGAIIAICSTLFIAPHIIADDGQGVTYGDKPTQKTYQCAPDINVTVPATQKELGFGGCAALPAAGDVKYWVAESSITSDMSHYTAVGDATFKAWPTKRDTDNMIELTCVAITCQWSDS